MCCIRDDCWSCNRHRHCSKKLRCSKTILSPSFRKRSISIDSTDNSFPYDRAGPGTAKCCSCNDFVGRFVDCGNSISSCNSSNCYIHLVASAKSFLPKVRYPSSYERGISCWILSVYWISPTHCASSSNQNRFAGWSGTICLLQGRS